MEVIWTLEKASVRDVTEELQKKIDVAYNTVQTMLRILEKKGYVKHAKVGRTFIYQPKGDKKVAQQEALKQVLNSFFADSPQSLVANLIEDEEVTNSEIDEIRKLINNY